MCILGRQPTLGLAELESRFGSAVTVPLAFDGAAGLDIAPEHVPIKHLGGTVKAARVLTFLQTTAWRDIAAYLIKIIPQHLQYLPPDGKIKIGLSTHGLKVHTSELTRTGLEIKKAVKAAGRSVRIVPNNALALSSAQVTHNQLTSPLGWELILIGDGNRTILAQTFAVQDIEAYAARDQARPMRDARVGMLPPKLAQIIVNLAVPGSLAGSASAGGTAATSAAADVTVLDPFCGTGVILQEALLMGYDALGTDLEPRMVEYSAANLNWLSEKYHLQETFHVSQGDATAATWQQTFTAVASETYLGRPLTTLPSPRDLDGIVNTGDKIHAAFLKNLAPQIPAGTRLCLAIPAWHTGPDNFRLLTFQKHLDKLGYKRVELSHVHTDRLIYFRPEQLVGRQLLTLEKK